jgi:hypothetical protein
MTRSHKSHDEQRARTKRPLYFLMRYSDNIKGFNTIDEHLAVLAKHGEVWMGKFGVGSGVAIIAQANEQIAKGVDTYLYLASKARVRYRSRILEVIGGGFDSRSFPASRKLIPAYYRNDACSVWFRLADMIHVPQTDVAMLAVYSDPSVKPEMNSSRGLVYVTHNPLAMRRYQA